MTIRRVYFNTELDIDVQVHVICIVQSIGRHKSSIKQLSLIYIYIQAISLSVILYFIHTLVTCNFFLLLFAWSIDSQVTISSSSHLTTDLYIHQITRTSTRNLYDHIENMLSPTQTVSQEQKVKKFVKIFHIQKNSVHCVNSKTYSNLEVGYWVTIIVQKSFLRSR